MLSLLARTLNVSVIEILDGEYSEKTTAELQSEKIVLEALKKAKKAQTKAILSVLAIILGIFILINATTYAYWGNRHKILYNVNTVFVHQSEENENIYDIYYNCSVKNWWFDFNKYNYNLKAELSGEPESWHFESETTSFSSSNLKDSTFIIHVEFNKSTVIGPVPSFKELITTSEFSAYNSNGEYDDRASLYMNDFENVKIIII